VSFPELKHHPDEKQPVGRRQLPYPELTGAPSFHDWFRYRPLVWIQKENGDSSKFCTANNNCSPPFNFRMFETTLTVGQMLRRAGTFAPSNQMPADPRLEDSEAVLESKWRKWAERESFKRCISTWCTLVVNMSSNLMIDLFFTSSSTISKHLLDFKSLLSFPSPN
jgi:hypothetical protein